MTYGFPVSVTDTATRGSRARLRALREPGPVRKASRPPSQPTQSGTTCGPPSGSTVARCATCGPATSARTASGTWAGPGTGAGVSVVMVVRPSGGRRLIGTRGRSRTSCQAWGVLTLPDPGKGKDQATRRRYTRPTGAGRFRPVRPGRGALARAAPPATDGVRRHARAKDRHDRGSTAPAPRPDRDAHAQRPGARQARRRHAGPVARAAHRRGG